MTVKTGLEMLLESFPSSIRGSRIGVLCNSASVTSSYRHIVDILAVHPHCTLAAVFGPQHGLFGQTQDNMVEWEGHTHPEYNVPVYSLYGETRKPTPRMLDGIDVLIVDLQDVGARPYTYIWTVKLCLEACSEAGVRVMVLDRPNPIGALPFDGPVLSKEFFSFVGGAEIPLCHRLTIGELSVLIKQLYCPTADLTVIWMEGWRRRSLWRETGLQWVLPSPNMPTPETALVYPGMVLLEATNLSEGRGTTRPFEIFGAPYINAAEFKRGLSARSVEGCLFRPHNFIPTFQKHKGEYCFGMQIHVTDPGVFHPVYAAAAVIASAIEAGGGNFFFKEPPYEYEREKMPFDILSGDTRMRKTLQENGDIRNLKKEWEASSEKFIPLFKEISRYPEEKR